MSTIPPGGKPAIKCTGLVGYVSAIDGAAGSVTAAVANPKILLRVSSIVIFHEHGVPPPNAEAWEQ